nr:UvrD-like helicase, ATP-binding domain, P-loop containing nucleoside triphosphate hydrolase [Tanacetum cinerariifolium]
YEEVPNGEDVKNVEDLKGDSDGEIVPDTKFEEDFPNQKGEEDSVGGNVFWVKSKEVTGWIPDFVEHNDEEEDLEVGLYEEVPNGEDVKNVEDLKGDSDGEIVPDTKFEEDFPNQK